MTMTYACKLWPVDTNVLKRCIENVRGKVDMIYLHWSAGRYHEIYDDYHISVDNDGRIYMPALDLTRKRNHTYQRNSNAVGIAVCAACGAVANDGYNADLGEYPVTQNQIEVMSYIVSLFTRYGGIPLENVLTHCEAALQDGYGPYSGDPETRWDLWYLPDYDGVMRGGGEVIRGKARWYLQQHK